MFNPYSTMCNQLVFRLLLGGKFTTTRLLVWLGDLDAFKRKADKAQVLQQFTAFGQWIGRLVSNWLVVPTAFIRIAQKRHLAPIVTKQDVLHGVTLFLAAIVRLLLSIVVRAGDRSFGAIVIKRGAVSSCSCSSV